MNFTTEQQENILFRLGYSESNATDYESNLEANYFAVRVARVDSIMSELAIVDEKILLSLDDSMALKVDSIEVDFQQHYKHLLVEGTKLLRELSNITGIPIFYDKYRSNCANDPTMSLSNNGGASSSNTLYRYY